MNSAASPPAIFADIIAVPGDPSRDIATTLECRS